MRLDKLLRVSDIHWQEYEHNNNERETLVFLLVLYHELLIASVLFGYSRRVL